MTQGDRATPLLGASFAHVDLRTASRMLLSRRGLRTAVPWRLVNAYSVALAAQDDDYLDLLRGDGVNLADGKPVAWLVRELSRRAGSSTAPGHVRGPSFFERVLDEGREAGVRHYLLGSTPETLDALCAAISARFPGADVVGAESPPFRPLSPSERSDQDGRIRESGADLVWVGLGTPRQDVEAARLALSVSRPVIAVGAAFDFLAGTKAEAPVWVQRASLEWLFRLLSEPGRLWRRYTVELARFVVLSLRELARRPNTVPASVRALAEHRSGTSRPEWFTEPEKLGA